MSVHHRKIRHHFVPDPLHIVRLYQGCKVLAALLIYCHMPSNCKLKALIMPGYGAQIQTKSEGVAAAWQMVETQREDLAKQQARLAEQASSLQEDTQ